MVGRRAARQIAAVRLPFAVRARLWVFWLFYAAVNGELKTSAGNIFLNGDRMDAKQRPSSIESTATGETELIERSIYLTQLEDHPHL